MVLNSLFDAHPIVPKILEYRELFKLFSTYIEPLIEHAKLNESHKIYTSFMQTGTSTGRLSSKNPNLQNIPVKTAQGRRIRQGFIAQENHLLLSLDYSQIELRLLAHFSQDKAMIEAFCHNADIHLETAKKFLVAQKRKKNAPWQKVLTSDLSMVWDQKTLRNIKNQLSRGKNLHSKLF